MAVNLDIGKSQSSDMTNKVEDWAVTPMQTDGIADVEETTYTNTNWTRQWGYFNTIPDLKSAILMKSIWKVGKGYTTDVTSEVILSHITGWGKDTFKSILFNLDVIASIGGDSYAEIVRDEETGTLINLKPLDPSTMRHHIGRDGRIDHYEQISKVKGNKPKKFQPEEILHFCNNRLADQIHGISDIDALEEVIKAEAESFADMKRIMHRQVRPFIIFKIKSDDTTTIDKIIGTIDEATNKGENMYIVDDDSVMEWQEVKINVSEIVLAWRTDIRNKFYRALGLPLIIFGSSGSTESGGKMEYLGHEQIFEWGQRNIEDDIFNQLGIQIDLISPVKLLENLQSDQNKDAQQGLELQQNDLTAGSGR